MTMQSAGTRVQRRHAARLEQRAIKTGLWGEWERTALPHGIPGADGWCAEIREVFKNNLYVVLVRLVATEWGEVQHLAIRTASSLEPPWRDMQRIKDELFGPWRTAVEVQPPAAELVDAADMYHLWVLPDGFRLPFTLGRRT